MAVHDMLMAYRDTPHPATGVNPYQAMSNRPIRTKLSHATLKERSEQDDLIDERDKLYKEKMRRSGTNIREHNFVMGDYVLLKQKKVNKWSTAYEPTFCTVIRISGSTITARRVTDGREICRDSSHFKLANAIMHEEDGKGGHCADWREALLMNTGSADQPPEEPSQPQEEQLQLQDSPGQRDSLEENAVNQSPEDVNQQLEDNLPLSMVQDMPRPTRDKPRPAQDVPRAESSSRPRRERRRPAYLTDYVTWILTENS